MFKRLGTKLLMSTAYHSQIDGQFERTNQTVKIALRFFITKNSSVDWVTALLMIQVNMNNFLNAIIGLTSNELMYGFKVRDRLTVVSKKIDGKIMSNKEVKKSLDATRLRMRQEAADVVAFDNVKFKLVHDKRYKLLLMKEGDKAYLKLHKGYKLLDNQNKKLFNQRCGPFLVKRRVGRLAYELEFSPRWKVHLVISVTQLESAGESDPYDRKRPHYPGAVEVEGDSEFERSYEVEKIVDKRRRKYGQTMVTQYLIRWLGYGPEFDE